MKRYLFYNVNHYRLIAAEKNYLSQCLTTKNIKYAY